MDKSRSIFFRILPFLCGAFLAFSLYEIYDSIIIGNNQKLIVFIVLSAAVVLGLLAAIIGNVAARKRRNRK